MKPSVHQSNRGILNAEVGRQKFSLMRYQPAPDLAYFIEHYWVVRWDLRGQEPFQQQILSFPNVNLTFEQELSGTFTGVYGVPDTTFTRLLQEKGVTLGVKFHPGGFYPFWKQPISLLTGKTFSFQEIFGVGPRGLEEQIFAEEQEDKMVQIAEQFLRERQPVRDENVALLHTMVQTVMDDREITKVEDIVSRFDINKRTLQRLFNRYVGVSPKWVIKRYRLQEAAELMEQEKKLDWSMLSQDLGYYDQAHFIKDFKALLGKSPLEYVKNNR